jgi:hypothetical protein
MFQGTEVSTCSLLFVFTSVRLLEQQFCSCLRLKLAIRTAVSCLGCSKLPLNLVYDQELFEDKNAKRRLAERGVVKGLKGVLILCYFLFCLKGGLQKGVRKS